MLHTTKLDPYRVVFPKEIKVPILISCPHSGRHYPPEFIREMALPLNEIRRSEDRLVDRLFADAPEAGAILLTAQFARSWIDLNRDWREVDVAMFDTPPHVEKLVHSQKVAAGFGLIHKVGGRGNLIYRGALPCSEYEHRLATAWLPYHEAISSILAGLKDRFGYAILIDAHSMPPLPYSKPCYAVVGDRYGKSCSPSLTAHVELQLEKRGFLFRRNTPYAGGYITDHYGDPEGNVHSIQIEICRSRYLNSSTLEPNNLFEKAKLGMSDMISELIFYFQENNLT